MNDEPSRLQLLRFARRVAVQQATGALAKLDGWTAAEEQHETERRRSEEIRPTPPEWLLQHGLNRTNIHTVHAGECWAAAENGRCRPASRQQAVEALRQQIPRLRPLPPRHSPRHPRMNPGGARAARHRWPTWSQARP